jgi:hypothetical protein
MTVKLSASRTGRSLLPRNIKTQGIVLPEGLSKFNYVVVSRTRDLLAYGIVSQSLCIQQMLGM